MVAARFPCDVNVWCIHLRPDCDLVTDVIRQAQPKVTQKEKRTWMTKPVHSDQPPWEMVPIKKIREKWDNYLVSLSTIWFWFEQVDSVDDVNSLETVETIIGNLAPISNGAVDGRQLQTSKLEIWRRFQRRKRANGIELIRRLAPILNCYSNQSQYLMNRIIEWWLKWATLLRIDG